MQRLVPVLFALGLATAAACQPTDTLTCGEGTRQEGNTCVADVPDTDSTVADTPTTPTDDTEPPSEPPVDPTPQIDKSAKRGIAYNLVQASDIDALKPGVSWWYNWYFTTGAPADAATSAQMEFIPMLWGYNGESDYQALTQWLLDHPETNDVLVLNEPNLVNQANMYPEAAVSEWLRYEQFRDDMLEDHGRTIRLIGPAMTWGTLPGYGDPIVWLDAFYAAFRTSQGRDPHIDVLAFHWYDYGLDEQLTRLESYGKPFWVTEMANWHTEPGWTIDTPEKQLATMIDMVSICESRDDVERYAWFIGRWDPDPHYTSLFEDAAGDLTPLGEAYLDQPW